MIIVAFIFGAIIGSYLACQYDRFQAGWGIKDASVKPSQCMSCRARLKWWHNIPIISYMLLKGRCSYCDAAIPSHVFWVELAVALLAVCLYILLA